MNNEKEKLAMELLEEIRNKKSELRSWDDANEGKLWKEVIDDAIESENPLEKF